MSIGVEFVRIIDIVVIRDETDRIDHELAIEMNDRSHIEPFIEHAKAKKTNLNYCTRFGFGYCAPFGGYREDPFSLLRAPLLIACGLCVT